MTESTQLANTNPTLHDMYKEMKTKQELILVHMLNERYEDALEASYESLVKSRECYATLGLDWHRHFVEG